MMHGASRLTRHARLSDTLTRDRSDPPSRNLPDTLTRNLPDTLTHDLPGTLTHDLPGTLTRDLDNSQHSLNGTSPSPPQWRATVVISCPERAATHQDHG